MFSAHFGLIFTCTSNHHDTFLSLKATNFFTNWLFHSECGMNNSPEKCFTEIPSRGPRLCPQRRRQRGAAGLGRTPMLALRSWYQRVQGKSRPGPAGAAGICIGRYKQCCAKVGPRSRDEHGARVSQCQKEIQFQPKRSSPAPRPPHAGGNYENRLWEACALPAARYHTSQAPRTGRHRPVRKALSPCHRQTGEKGRVRFVPLS